MFGLHGLTRPQRLVLGIVVLLIVDLIWVASAELTEYLFKRKHFNKPFFTTYSKTSMFVLYLVGFIVWEPWRYQCKYGNVKANSTPPADGSSVGNSDADTLSEPVFIPIKFDDKASGTESDDSAANHTLNRSVRFSKVSEVRQLSETYAEEAVIARLSYSASLRAEEARLRAMSKLTIKQVAKMAFLFCLMWFFGNYAYQLALLDTEAGVVNVLSSTSGLFTLVCAAIYPSSGADRFTLSKLVTVLISIGGIVMVCLSDKELDTNIPVGALWALCGAMLYALYLVSLRRRVDHEDKLDIPMFFGFVGLFCMLLLWPGFFMLHFSGSEDFEWPNGEQWLYIVLNGIIGTVLSEFLWLWGCFLTSSLIGTLSLSLTIPLTMMADIVIKGVNYTWMFHVGTIPVFVAFFGVTFLTHYENWDPVLIGCRKLLHCICRRRPVLPRVRDMDREQTESLIDVAGTHQ
ncbi:solute carrier family 35 member F5-like isoform X1 [Mizuhopecten yessoensis]|uniref:Solute carrier family 35 member F5 n=2 Tax=Mizuhopecten yessoensis TaxID=6573 RepID=A0A210QS82_MIZYE|nr:solute carrier family 35 member F5-like isoform X1 [Mizuhopecten yessoensis]XP_021351242.1 solute carrier family 35 member F5-like isoform X1 [Mizuhopecten yessoensis]OWF51586.1 Solute carrier family 35 member F5 [Mizuhopecten yessoensis]